MAPQRKDVWKIVKVGKQLIMRKSKENYLIKHKIDIKSIKIKYIYIVITYMRCMELVILQNDLFTHGKIDFL